MVQSQIQDETHDFLLLSAQLYASRFTDAELDQLIAFYSSGIGAKYFRERAELDSQETGTGFGLEQSSSRPRSLEEVRAKMSAGKRKTP